MGVPSGMRHFGFDPQLGFCLQPILHVASFRTTFLQIDGVCVLGDLVLGRPSFGSILDCVFVFLHLWNLLSIRKSRKHHHCLDALLITTTSRTTTSTATTVQIHIPPPIHPSWFIITTSLPGRRGFSRLRRCRLRQGTDL